MTMGLNHSAVWSKIQELVGTSQPTGKCMSEVIGVCVNGVPHADWSRLAAIDYDTDVVSLQSWIPDIIKKTPAPFAIQGLWIGLNNPCESKKVWADMYVEALSLYDSKDEELEWLWKGGSKHYPDDAYAHSASLKNIYQIAYGSKEGLGNNAEWPLCLAFAAFAVRSLLNAQTPKLVGSNAKKIGVAVGFDSGDMLKIGELTEDGFAVVQSKP
jgi:hypothetical protein